jgi:hypothetical protein
MAVYEMVIRFEAGDDTEALAFGVDVEKTVRAEDVLTPAEWGFRSCRVEQLHRVVVTNMPLEDSRADGHPG